MSQLSRKQYTKITDTIYQMSSDTRLTLNVKFQDRSNGDDFNWHREVGYYKDDHKVVNIIRSIEYFASIDTTIDKEKFGILLRVQDFLSFINLVRSVTEWFTGNKQIFAADGDNLSIIGSIEPVSMAGLIGNKYISVTPSVVTNRDGTHTPGARFTLGNEYVYTDMDVDKIFGLYYVIKDLNLYQAASTLVNYRMLCEPGTNLFETGNRIGDDGTAVRQRIVGFFDK